MSFYTWLQDSKKALEEREEHLENLNELSEIDAELRQIKGALSLWEKYTQTSQE